MIVAHETSWSSLSLAFVALLIVKYCEPQRAPSRPKGSVERLIPRPTTKIARDLSSQELFLSSLDPLNLPMRHDLAAIHAERFVHIPRGQIDSAVSGGSVNCGLSTYGSGRGTSLLQANEGTVSRGLSAEGTNVLTWS
jgi:hypothetical protein